MGKFKKAIFWDRDGVINEIKVKNGVSLSPRRFSDFKIYPFIESIFDEFLRMGFLNIVFTNQPDISRKLMDLKELELMHEYLFKKVPISDIYVCPHSDHDKCSCRKPLPGMINSALEKYQLLPENCIVVGDRVTDIISGFRAGIENLFLLERSYSFNRYLKKDLPIFKRISDLTQMLEIIKKRK